MADRVSERVTRTQRLKWLAIVAPVVYVAALETLRRVLIPDILSPLLGYYVLGVLLLGGVYFFTQGIFSMLGQMHDQLVQQNKELLILHEASIDITSELELELVLQRVVDRARELMGARYGALSLLRDSGGIEAFLTSGISQEQREEIGPIPEGHGLLGVVLKEGETLRLQDLTQHPQSTGFPDHHPPMFSLLAVPIMVKDRVVGNLYLTEKIEDGEFTEWDEDTLRRFATHSALAIENARLHREVQAMTIVEERERLAREMHDSLAQLLGYVNTKAQAAEQFLIQGKTEEAAKHLDQLASAARDAYADVREGILGLRTTSELNAGFIEALQSYIERWQDQNRVPLTMEVTGNQRIFDALSPLAELQLLRIIQEALSNVRKHANADETLMRLDAQDMGIEVLIRDNGVGFDPVDTQRRSMPRFGLSIMKERAEAVGGWLTIESIPEGGTEVRGYVPAQVKPLASGGDNARTDR